jgi:hypothetical protein
MQKKGHWLLDAIMEMEEFADKNNLQGVVQGLGDVLEVYASEAIRQADAREAVISRVRKEL